MSQATPTVFIVDDDISVRESLEALIRFEGWQAETFASGQDFLARPRTLTNRHATGQSDGVRATRPDRWVTQNRKPGARAIKLAFHLSFACIVTLDRRCGPTFAAFSHVFAEAEV